MADSIEKEEFGDHKRLYEHYGARSDHREEADYIHHTDGVENDIPWTSQRAFNERHFRERPD